MPRTDAPATAGATLPAAIIIGRNEGHRLIRCLAAAAPEFAPLIYVDSGSRDGSVDAARAAGAQVVALDMDRPFTAARARNSGFAALQAQDGAMPEFVQFIDGDCEMQPAWADRAVALLRDRPDIAIVAGRVRERHPEASVFNRLCDAEWDAPAGPADAVGGIFLARSAAFAAVGGFDPTLIAGEEPDLCHRLRDAGWRIWRLADEMTLHDAAMTRFGQWWRRALRGGHAAAEGAARHGDAPGALGAHGGQHRPHRAVHAEQVQLQLGVGVPGVGEFPGAGDAKARVAHQNVDAAGLLQHLAHGGAHLRVHGHVAVDVGDAVPGLPVAGELVHRAARLQQLPGGAAADAAAAAGDDGDLTHGTAPPGAAECPR